jgi:hypothetical protein
MIARRILQRVARHSSRLPVVRGFCQQQQPKPSQTPTPKPSAAEDYYRARITVEVEKEGAVLENQEEVPHDPTAIIPEKDKAFVAKKTSLKEKLKVMMVQLKESFIAFFKDVRFIWRAFKAKGFRDEQYTLHELRERRRIAFDFVKFIPYSVMIIVPGAELFFPPYVLLFPNSTPTKFIPLNSLGERTAQLAKKQEEGYELFVPSLPRFAALLDIDPALLLKSLSNLQQSQGLEKDWQYYQASDIEAKLSGFLDRPDLPRHSAAFNLARLSSFELEQLNKVFFYLYIPGYNFLNIAYGLFFKAPFYLLRYFAKWRKWPNPSRFTDNPFCRFSFKLDWGPLAFLKKRLLLTQLRYHMWQLRRQDRALAKDFSQLSKLEQLDLVEYAKQRGINIDRKEEIVDFVQKYWLPLSLRQDIPSDLLIWIAVLRYKYAEILV